eukprot:jgi/Psemu1/27831/gm1.27831_g
MSMTSLSAQEEGRAFVEAAERTIKMDAALNTATQHFYKPEPVLEQLMSLPEPIKTPVFRAAQLHGTYFKCEDEDERDTRISQLDVFQHSDSSLGTNDNNYNDARGRQDPLAFGHLCLKWQSATKARRAQHLGLEKILFQQSDAKRQESSDNTSWNNPPFDADSSPPNIPATATTYQLGSVEGAIITAEKEKKKGAQLNPTNWSTKVRWR